MNPINEQDKLTSQWITSLAISVVCCAALFLIFAGYIIDLHDKASLNAIRLEVLQERQNQLVAELDAMRRPIPVTTANPMAQKAPADPAAVGQPAAPAVPAAPASTTGTMAPPATSPVPAAPVVPAAPSAKP